MTRATVLALSGWSNTQFSYWARRIEAVSVLASCDDRLRAVRNALEQRLKDVSIIDNNSPNPDTVDKSSSEADASSSSLFPAYAYVQNVTGKGLDNVIDGVKKRSGANQFLRGKRSSLDPFGTNSTESDRVTYTERSAPIYMPTFQARPYVHALLPQLTAPQPNSKTTKRQEKKHAPNSSSRDDHSQKPCGIFGTSVPQPHLSTTPHSDQLVTLDRCAATQPFAPNVSPNERDPSSKCPSRRTHRGDATN